jgi:hypothetical protein
MPNLIGKNITLDVKFDVGTVEGLRITFVDGEVQLSEEMLVMRPLLSPAM